MEAKINIGTIIWKSYLAGILIGLGGFAYLSVDNPVIGSLLFSFGLITIIAKKYMLYTGSIAYANYHHIPAFSLVLVYNLLGTSTVGLIAKYCSNIDANTIVLAKLSKPYYTVFFMAVVCGVLMYLGVSTSKALNQPLYAMLAVMIFILTGAEHCIANSFYFTVTSTPLAQSIPFMVVNILGNTVGAILYYNIEKISIE